MSIDVNDIKRKLEALKNNKSISSNSGQGHNYYKPSDGDKIRFILKPGDDDPITEYNWHYPKKGSSFVCNKRTYGGDCVICDTASELWNTYVDGGKQNEGLKDAAKKLFASARYYSPVVVRGKESEGVHIYGYGKEVAADFMGTLVDVDYDVSVLDAVNGRDFTVSQTEKGGNSKFKNSTYTSTSIKASPKKSPIVPEGVTGLSVGELYEQIPDMKHLFREAKPEDMLIVIDEYLSNIMPADSGDDSDGSDDSNAATSDVDEVTAAMNKLK
jgi:hypothetical protein